MKTFITIKKHFLLIVVGVIVCAALCFLTCTNIEEGYGLTPPPPPPTFTLTTDVTPNEGGKITRVPNKTHYHDGESVQLTALPDDFYLFMHWEGASIWTTVSTNVQINIVIRENEEVTAVFKSIFNPDINYGDFIDSRDERTYRYVTIGTQTWMAQNLNFAADGSSCNNCNTYGRLYNWDTAQEICPNDWRLPTNDEWETLVNFGDNMGRKLKSSIGWTLNPNIPVGTDDYGFSGLPSGAIWSNGSPSTFGSFGYWWTATEHDETNGQIRSLTYNGSNVDSYHSDKTNKFSVRCIKD